MTDEDPLASPDPGSWTPIDEPAGRGGPSLALLLGVPVGAAALAGLAWRVARRRWR